MIRVIVTHANGTVLARETFEDVELANRWLEKEIEAGRFGRTGRWMDECDVIHHGLKAKDHVIYVREWMGHKTYYVTSEYEINTEPM